MTKKQAKRADESIIMRFARKHGLTTVQDFYDKYGTGKNYEDFFAMMCEAKKEQNPVLAYDVEQFIEDLRKVCNNDFDAFLWRDYQFISNWG